ncbi:MAG: GAF domain-containing protein [Chloroflexi bacterium]|nr:MAG: GAF domain-containing protein [Chloroflexota bacterium]
MGDAYGQHAGLAAAGAGKDQERDVAVRDGVSLGWIKALEERVGIGLEGFNVNQGKSSLPMSGGANLGSRLTADMAADGDIHIRDHVLYELARDLSSSLELDSVLRNVMDRVISLMHASRGFIVLVDPVTNEMSVQMGGGETDTEKSRHFLGSKTVPLVTKGKVIGAVYVDNPFRAAIFEEKDKEFLQAISDLAAIAIDNARQYERSEFLRHLFERYVNKQVTDYVLERSVPGTVFLPGERRHVTMLNSDIAGFSTLSQRMPAQELVNFLNKYFGRMIDIVLMHGGNIDKFQGDGMLVVFGAPNPMDDHAERAYEAAQAMVQEVDRLNGELSGDGLPTIAIGIGLDTGEVVAGHVGSPKRLEFTLIGVPVNNSAYLSKVRPPRVLMSEATRDALLNKVSVVDYEPMLLKGASEKQPIFQLEILEVTTES